MPVRISLATALCALLFGALPLRAESPFYLFGKIGSTSVDTSLGRELESLFDGDDDSLGLGLGFRLGKHFAFEAQHQDFGSVRGLGAGCTDPRVLCLGAPVVAEMTAISVSALAHLALGERFLLFGKLGVISRETELSGVPADLERRLERIDDEDLVLGGGLRFLLPGPLDLYAEAERFGGSFDTVSVGVTFGF